MATTKQKQAARQGIAEVVSHVCDLPIENVSILVEEFDPADWGRARSPSRPG